MKTLNKIFMSAVAVLALTACQDDDIDISAPVLSPIDASTVTGALVGDDYVWSWQQPAAGTKMQVSTYSGNILSMTATVDGTSYTHYAIDTNIAYTYVFKLTDGTNYSSGVVKSYTRPGAAKMAGLSMKQVDKTGGYDVAVEWQPNPTATSIQFAAATEGRRVDATLDGNATSYTIADVVYGQEWTVTLTAVNAEGSSLPASSTLRIGKTAIGFLSIYPTADELMANGDDDEICAWLWTHEEYPSAQYVYFGDITSADCLEPYRVLFWMRDLEGVGEEEVFTMPGVVADATLAVSQWYADGGNLLLWSHATVYICDLGRLDKSLWRNNDRAIGTGFGGWNGDVWAMAVQLHPGSRFKKDHSTHPIYKGLEVTETDRTKLIKFKGAGWTEDHNCLSFNLPSALTGIGNQEEACYTAITEQYGIYPLGTWDSQIDWVSQLNVWEAQQGDTAFKGTVICIGNGGCEFSMRNADGTPDISAYPGNNPYQDNVLTLAKNCLEYLKTR